MNPIKIGNQRELFWDDYLVNTSLTGAYLKQHQPQQKERILTCDMPWEGDGSYASSIVYDNGVYKMYYEAWRMLDDEVTTHPTNCVSFCVLESTDGLNWVRPELEIRPFPGCPKNNIILDQTDGRFDNFCVFIDERPGCPPEERYKANSICDKSGYLWCWTSPDGYHWTKAWQMTNKSIFFDTANIGFWSPEHGKYFCFIRGWHDVPVGDWNAGVRDVRVMTSDDYRTWTDPVPVDFGSSDDIPLYTNMVFRYPRAPQMMVGMPSRYVERHAWTENYDQLTGAEARKQLCKVHPRYGLAITDCVLMTSRDGFHWKRWDEAWMTPGPEQDYNWVYGDCYPVPMCIETPSPYPGAANELSFYTKTRSWSNTAAIMWRYSIRVDGLISYRADYAPKTVVTKPLLYEGGKLSLNFATSARGYIYVTAKCGKEVIKSCELFGDTLDRIVPFDGDLETFAGKEITLEFTMSDADLFSMQFVKE